MSPAFVVPLLPYSNPRLILEKAPPTGNPRPKVSAESLIDWLLITKPVFS